MPRYHKDSRQASSSRPNNSNAKLPRCFYCRRRGVRTQECRCKRNRIESISTNKNRYDTGILLNVEGKRVRAVINTEYQETRISQGVLEFLKKKRPLNISKKVLHSVFGMETLSTLTITIHLDNDRQCKLDCYVDARVRRNEMVIGLIALMKLGHRFTVAGMESRLRRHHEEPHHNQESLRERDEDQISFLDEDEARRIEEWTD